MQMTTRLLLMAVVLSHSLSVVLGAEDRCFDTDTHDIKLEELLGVWYPMEIVLHRNDSKIYGVPTETQCPEVTITMVGKKGLRMYWNATEGDLEYRYTQKGKLSSPMFQVSAEQTGVYTHPTKYNATVMAVNPEKYMIIRLCGARLNNMLLLSKKNGRSEEVMNKFGEVLKSYQFPQFEKIAICSKNAGVSNGISTAILFTYIFLLILLLRQ